MVTAFQGGCPVTQGGQDNGMARPDPEVPERPRRRRFTAEYKLRIVKEAEACQAGEIGALLRREGLYSSHLSKWREQYRGGAFKGLQAKKRGPAPNPDKRLAKEVEKLERENQRLRKRLQQAETIIEFQKKVSEMLGIPLKDVENGASE
jgi:transposase-like protein